MPAQQARQVVFVAESDAPRDLLERPAARRHQFHGLCHAPPLPVFLGRGAEFAAEEDAQSFGPVESDLFLESKMPSLYDVASEIYGKPPKPNEQRNKTIALGTGKIKHPKGRTARTQRSGREFSTVRRLDPPSGKKLADRDAPALLYVIGRSPQQVDAFLSEVVCPIRRRYGDAAGGSIELKV